MKDPKQGLIPLWASFFIILAVHADTVSASPPYIYQVMPAATLPSRSTSKIAFISERNDQQAIYIMNSDGSEQHALQNDIPGNGISEPQWSADGTQILFSLSYPVARGITEVHIVNADGSNPQVITTDNNTIPADPALSLDGKHIAFVSNQDGAFKIYVMNRNGSNQHRLTELETHDAPDPKFQTQPSWSPLGSTLAFVSEGKNDSTIMLVKLDSSAPYILVDNVAPGRPFEWSPDGHSIAYISNEHLQLCILNIERKTQSCLPNFTDVTVPHWSPNGQFLSFTAPHREGYDVFVLEVATSKVQELTDNGSITNVLISANYDAIWSPDGKQLIFTSGDDFVIPGDVRPARIYVINADGSNLKALTRDTARNYSPSWQP